MVCIGLLNPFAFTCLVSSSLDFRANCLYFYSTAELVTIYWSIFLHFWFWGQQLVLIRLLNSFAFTCIFSTACDSPILLILRLIFDIYSPTELISIHFFIYFSLHLIFWLPINLFSFIIYWCFHFVLFSICFFYCHSSLTYHFPSCSWDLSWGEVIIHFHQFRFTILSLGLLKLHTMFFCCFWCSFCYSLLH